MINTLTDKDIKRFWSKINVMTEDECWNWKYKSHCFRINHKTYTSYRISYLLKYGEIDKNERIRHSCHNDRCCNYYHLYVATDQDTTKYKKREYLLAKTYGLTMKEYQLINMAQNERCAICGEKETRTLFGNVLPLCVDHDHTTGKIRALLCHHCNILVGFHETSQKDINRIIKYLDGYGV